MDHHGSASPTARVSPTVSRVVFGRVKEYLRRTQFLWLDYPSPHPKTTLKGAIIIHTASVLLFDWDMLWTDLNEILCIHLSQKHTYLQSNRKVLKIKLYIGGRRLQAAYCLSCQPRSP